MALLAAFPAFAQEPRQMDAHEHGVGTLNIAIDGTKVAMEFHAPGADIVGFEYAAESDADRASIEAAIATLSDPLKLFAMPAAADCSATAATAELEGEDGHDDHDEAHDAEHKHEEHADEHHAEHEDHEEHSENAGHTKFHAEYTLVCDNPDALTEITFAYFEAFPNAKEVEVQIVSASGAQAHEVERDAPVLDLKR
jgi:hypothetical protein